MQFTCNHSTLPFFFMTKNIDFWHEANNNSQLLSAVSMSDLKDVASMAALRKLWNVDEISIAASILDARKRAQGKLEHAESVISDSVGVQQATSTQIAKHKSKRFDTDTPIFDLCCGIGSDLRELPAHTIGVDHDPLRCWMAQQNTCKETRCEDALGIDLSRDALVHIDPSRRNDTKRLHSLVDMQPSMKDISKIVSRCAGGCIKVSPSVNAEDMEHFDAPFELEYIEEYGRVVQGIIWFGSLALHAGGVTATSMSTQQSISSSPKLPPFGNEILGWILEPNPALERAGLHGNVACDASAFELAPGIGLLTSTENPNTHWCTAFEVLETTPLRIEKVTAALSQLGCSQVEVKTRNKTIDPNEWQKKLTTKSKGELLTVFALRLGKKRFACITRRHGSQ
jgi:hypothetical protein